MSALVKISPSYINARCERCRVGDKLFSTEGRCIVLADGLDLGCMVFGSLILRSTVSMIMRG